MGLGEVFECFMPGVAFKEEVLRRYLVGLLCLFEHFQEVAAQDDMLSVDYSGLANEVVSLLVNEANADSHDENLSVEN